MAAVLAAEALPNTPALSSGGLRQKSTRQSICPHFFEQRV